MGNNQKMVSASRTERGDYFTFGDTVPDACCAEEVIQARVALRTHMCQGWVTFRQGHLISRSASMLMSLSAALHARAVNR